MLRLAITFLTLMSALVWAQRGGSPASARSGYLTPADAPDVARIVPPAPSTGDARFVADMTIFRNTRSLEGSERWALALADDNVSIAGLYPSGQPRSVASSGPAGWGEVSHGGEIASGHAGQYGQKIILHGNAQAAARFHHRENGCDLWSGLRTAYV